MHYAGSLIVCLREQKKEMVVVLVGA